MTDNITAPLIARWKWRTRFFFHMWRISKDIRGAWWSARRTIVDSRTLRYPPDQAAADEYSYWDGP